MQKGKHNDKIFKKGMWNKQWNLLLVYIFKIVLALGGGAFISLSFVNAPTKLERQEVHSRNVLFRTFCICVFEYVYEIYHIWRMYV